MAEKSDLLEILYHIGRYLPSTYNNQENDDFIYYLRESIEEFLENEKYRFAVLGINMMYLSFLYQKTFQIIRFDASTDFAIKMIKGIKGKENFKTPFSFKEMKEGIFVKEISKFYNISESEVEIFLQQPVKHRNECSHANGKIYIRDIHNCKTIFQMIQNNIESIQSKHNQKLLKVLIDKFITPQMFTDADGKIFEQIDEKTNGLYNDNIFSYHDAEFLCNYLEKSGELNESLKTKKSGDNRELMKFFSKVKIMSFFFKCNLDYGFEHFGKNFTKIFLGDFQSLEIDCIDVLNYFDAKIVELDCTVNLDDIDKIYKKILEFAKEEGEKEIINEKIIENNYSKFESSMAREQYGMQEYEKYECTWDMPNFKKGKKYPLKEIDDVSGDIIMVGEGNVEVRFFDKEILEYWKVFQ